MKLSEQAKIELMEILLKELGEEALALFSDELLNDLGVRLLQVTTIILKSNKNKHYEIIRKKI